MLNQNPSKRVNRGYFRITLLVISCILVSSSLILPIAIRPSAFPLKEGDVVSDDIQASRSLTYVSSILTEEAQSSAEASVLPIYLPADPSITRRQIEHLRITLNYINVIREDTFSPIDQKLSDLAALDNIHFSADTSNQLLTLTNDLWQEVQQESLNVLEQVMRNTIRDNQIIDAQRNIPSLISFSFPEDQATVILEIVTPFIVANSIFSQEQTTAARLAARDAVKPVNKTYVSGQLIIQRGQIITPVLFEALSQFGLIQPERNSQDIFAILALVGVLGTLIAVYFDKRKIAPLYDIRSLAMISFLFVLFLFGARLIIPNRVVIPYLYPLAAFGLTISCLYNLELGLFLSMILSMLAGYNLPNSLDVTLFYIVTSWFGILVLGKGRRVTSFFLASLVIGVAGSAVILAYRLSTTLTDWIGVATLIGTSFLCGMASASLTLAFQYIFSQILGVTTALQLLEISRPDQPLLQYLLRSAPGTYQHSLQVANLAEQAAEAIGADGLLVRVGALYHDTGKALNSPFFIENQVPGKLDTHDDLDPAPVAAVIIQHVPDGIALAKKYHLPPRIQDFIREHHGTFLTRYQYGRAVQAAGNQPELVSTESYRYPGPRPRSKETALVMLADGCEARARADFPQTEEDIRILVKKVFEGCQREGQLDETNLTIRDLNKAMDSFVNTLKTNYHPRIAYPEIKPIGEPEETKVGASDDQH